jgi:hypothetical protein
MVRRAIIQQNYTREHSGEQSLKKFSGLINNLLLLVSILVYT